MIIRLQPLPILTLCLLFGSLPLHAEASTKGIDLKLISELSTIQPGKTFTVGLHIHHHEGYHTYWQNPGIVGLATQLDWTLPAGHSIGTINPAFPDKSANPTP